MTMTKSFLMSLGAGALAATMATFGLARPVMADDMGFMRHGQVSMVVSTSPPHLSGPFTNLAVKDGLLTGTVKGRFYTASIGAGHVEGAGPDGGITLDLHRGADGALQIKGKWNGQDVNLTFSSERIRGLVVRQAAGPGRAFESCEYDIGKEKPGVAGGNAFCLGDETPLRYELQPGVTGAFDQPDVALLVLAYLAAPPVLPVS